MQARGTHIIVRKPHKVKLSCHGTLKHLFSNNSPSFFVLGQRGQLPEDAAQLCGQRLVPQAAQGVSQGGVQHWARRPGPGCRLPGAGDPSSRAPQLGPLQLGHLQEPSAHTHPGAHRAVRRRDPHHNGPTGRVRGLPTLWEGEGLYRSVWRVMFTLSWVRESFVL